MKISTKGRYALRIMIDLAANQSDEPIRLKDIAERQDISVKYLEQIISLLTKAGYVKGARGAGGGYQLRKAPKDYTVGMILRTTEGSLAPVSCIEDGENGCQRSNSCATIMIWKKINDAVNGVVDGITLQDLVDWQRTGSSTV